MQFSPLVFISEQDSILCCIQICVHYKHYLFVYSSMAVKKWEGRSMRVCVTEPEVDRDEWLLFCSLPPTHCVMMSSSWDTILGLPSLLLFSPSPQKPQLFDSSLTRLVWWTVQRSKPRWICFAIAYIDCQHQCLCGSIVGVCAKIFWPQ